MARNGSQTETMVKEALVRARCQAPLQQAGVATNAEVASKFAAENAIQLSFDGLNTFFSGLEGVVGPFASPRWGGRVSAENPPPKTIPKISPKNTAKIYRIN